MASLANQTISSSYDGLVKTATDQPVGVSGVQLLEDGVGNSLALSVGRANQGVTVTGPLTGTLSATSVLADGVIATTQATSDNSTKVATTAYVKSVVTAEDLDIAGDSGTGSIDLDSQTLTIEGTANEIETSASGQTITIGLPSTITANVTGNVSGNLTGTVLTAAQANITSVGTLSSLAVSGAATVGTTLGVTGATSLDSNLSVNGTVLQGFAVNRRMGVDIGDGTYFFGISSNSNARGLDVISAASDSNLGIKFRTGLTYSTVVTNMSIDSDGLKFNGDTAAANALDDYEEGTWTPTAEGSTTAGTASYSERHGRYTKIGRQVYVEAFFAYSSGTGTGDLIISGLPFNSANSGTYPSFIIGALDLISMTAGYVPLAWQFSNTSNILLRQHPVGGGVQIAIPYDAAGGIQISGTYTV